MILYMRYFLLCMRFKRILMVYFLFVFFSSFIGNEKINYVIENAVSELDERYKQFFEYFSLFVEDINIKDEV